MGRRARRRSSRKRSGPRAYTRSCWWPWQAISWPRCTISRARAGWRSAIHPSTKKVARLPVASKASSSRRVGSPSREGSSSQRSRPISPSKFETWNHSSRSTLRALLVTLDAPELHHRLDRLPEDEEGHREGPVLQVVEVESELLLDVLDVVHVAAPARGPARDAGPHGRARAEVGVALGQSADELGAFGPGPDQAHVATEHVPELGQLVDARGAQEPAHAGHAVVLVGAPDGPGLGLRPLAHGAQFPDPEQPATTP